MIDNFFRFTLYEPYGLELSKLTSTISYRISLIILVNLILALLKSYFKLGDSDTTCERQARERTDVIRIY